MGDQHAETFRLSGSAAAGGGIGVLTQGRAVDGRAVVPPVPVSGLCTRSTSQWMAGLPSTALADLPCWEDNAANDKSGVVFQTEPLDAPLRLRGPINARLFTSSPSGDGMLSVSVSDVAPDGTVTRLTGGWQVLSHRALVKARSRYLDGRLVQPFHPFTKAAREPLASRRGRAGRRRDLPDRGSDRTWAPAADRDPGLRRPAPAAGAARPPVDAGAAHRPHRPALAVGAHDPGPV